MAKHSEAEAAPDLRRRILLASVQLLEEEGISALSLREVARRAGVSHQAPYHHFQDREAILGAIAQEGFRMLSESFESAVGKEAQPLERRVATAARSYIEFALAHPAHFRVMFRPELVNLERCPGAQAEGDRAFGLLQRFVADVVNEGLPAHFSQQALLLLFWSVAHGFACLALDGPLALKAPESALTQQIEELTHALGALVKNAVERR